MSFNKVMMGISIVGAASNEFANAMADGKGTVNEFVHGTGAVVRTALMMTGEGSKVVFTGDHAQDAAAVGARVQAAVHEALKDGSLSVSELATLAETIVAEAFDAAGIGDKVIVQA